jgi:hypothetical protein
MTHLNATGCCALGQLRANDSTTEEEINTFCEQMFNEAIKTYEVGDLSKKGQTTVFCTAGPEELNLQANLLLCGFQLLFTFPRRTGYPGGRISFYAKDILNDQSLALKSIEGNNNTNISNITGSNIIIS